MEIIMKTKQEKTCALENRVNPQVGKRTNLYSTKDTSIKLNSTAKIQSTSKINSSKIRQISSKDFQVTDKRKKNKTETLNLLQTKKITDRESNSGDNSSIEKKTTPFPL